MALMITTYQVSLFQLCYYMWHLPVVWVKLAKLHFGKITLAKHTSASNHWVLSMLFGVLFVKQHYLLSLLAHILQVHFNKHSNAMRLLGKRNIASSIIHMLVFAKKMSPSMQSRNNVYFFVALVFAYECSLFS